MKMFVVKKAFKWVPGAHGPVAATADFLEITRVRILRGEFHFDRIARFHVSENRSTWQ